MELVDLKLAALNKMKARMPLNSEVSMLYLIEAWQHHGEEANLDTLELSCEQVVNAIYCMLECEAFDIAKRALALLEGGNGFEADIALIRYRLYPEETSSKVEKEKILIATNLGELYSEDAMRRQIACLENSERIKAEDGNIELGNIAIDDEFTGREAWTEVALDRSSLEVDPNEERIPFIRDLFSKTARLAKERGYPYFAIINSDIYLTHESLFLIRSMLKERYETLGLTRTEIPEIGRMEPKDWVELHLSGTDLFAYRTDWWLENERLFEDYVMGCYWWDICYISIMGTVSRFLYLSNIKGTIFHVTHLPIARKREPLIQYNMSIRDTKDAFYWYVMNRYFDSLKGYIKTNRCLPSIEVAQGMLASTLKMTEIAKLIKH